MNASSSETKGIGDPKKMVSKNGRFMFKVALIGDYAVGKTSLIRRYMTDTFDEDYKATLGATVSSFETMINNSNITLQVWDLAGQTSFRRVRVQYLFGTDFAIVVYDVTRVDSLIGLDEWVKDVKNSSPNVFLYLVGNKIDLKDEQTVHRASAEQFRKEWNMLGLMETSAKDGTNVKRLFETVAELLLQQTAILRS